MARNVETNILKEMTLKGIQGIKKVGSQGVQEPISLFISISQREKWPSESHSLNFTASDVLRLPRRLVSFILAGFLQGFYAVGRPQGSRSSKPHSKVFMREDNVNRRPGGWL